MKNILLFIVLCTVLLVACGGGLITSTPTVIPTHTLTPVPSPTSTHTPTPTTIPTATLPPQVQVEFDENATAEEKDQILTALNKSLEFYQKKDFGSPTHALIIYAGSDKETLIDKSYAIFQTLYSSGSKNEFAQGWSEYTGGINLVGKDMTGYIFINLAYPYGDTLRWQGYETTLRQCTVVNETLHVFHQWLSGVNFIDDGTSPRPSTVNGPQWIKIGKEDVVCGYVFDVPVETNRERILENLSLVSSDVNFKQLEMKGDTGNDEQGYLRNAAVFFLMAESPGGRENGIKTLAMFFSGLSDPNLTWQEVFANTWGWTVDEFYEKFEQARPSLTLP